MSISALVTDRPDDVERLRNVVRAPPRVRRVGIGTGLGLWILGSLLVGAVLDLL